MVQSVAYTGSSIPATGQRVSAGDASPWIVNYQEK